MKEYYRKENGVIRYYQDGVPSVPAEVVAEKPKKESKKSKKYAVVSRTGLQNEWPY